MSESVHIQPKTEIYTLNDNKFEMRTVEDEKEQTVYYFLKSLDGKGMNRAETKALAKSMSKAENAKMDTLSYSGARKIRDDDKLSSAFRNTIWTDRWGHLFDSKQDELPLGAYLGLRANLFDIVLIGFRSDCDAPMAILKRTKTEDAAQKVGTRPTAIAESNIIGLGLDKQAETAPQVTSEPSMIRLRRKM